MDSNVLSPNNHDISVSISGQTLDSSESAGVLMSKYKTIFMDTRKRYEEAIAKARDSQELADEAHGQSAGWGHKKAAIEGLQDAVQSQAELSNSIIDLSKYQMDMTATLSKLTHATVMVSTINLGRAKTMQQELANELNGLTESTDDERQALLRENIKSTLAQINESIDLMQKQDAQAQKIKDLAKQEQLHSQKDLERDNLLKKQSLNDLNHNKNIQALYKENDEQDELIKNQALRDKEHDQKIENLYKENDDQDELLRQQDLHNREHAKKIENLFKENDDQDELLRKEELRNKEHAKRIETLYKENDDQDELLEQEKQRSQKHAKEIESLYKENDDQDELLKQQSVKNEEQGKKIDQLSDELLKQQNLLEEAKQGKDELENRLRQRTIIFSVIDVILVIAVISGMLI